MTNNKLWVKFRANNATKVSIGECQNVDDFLGACKKELSNSLGQFPSGGLSLATTEGGPSLRPGLLLSEIKFLCSLDMLTMTASILYSSVFLHFKKVLEVPSLFQSLVGVQLSYQQKKIFWTKFSNQIILLEKKLMNIREARRLLNSIRSTLQSETIAEMIREGFVFDGFLPTVSGRGALLYRVIEVSTYEIYCAKIYRLEGDDLDSFTREQEACTMIHQHSIHPNVVHYKAIEFSHVNADSVKLGALLMPLYRISLSEIIQANCDSAVPINHFKKITLGLLAAGASFQENGLAHCDIKPSNIMMENASPVLIDLGAVTHLGKVAEEYTKFYALDSNVYCVDTQFDLNCIVATLLQCFKHELKSAHRTRQNVIQELFSSSDCEYSRICRQLLNCSSCSEALASIKESGLIE